MLKWILIASTLAFAGEEAPDWFAPDTENVSEWTFYCRGDGATEEEAGASASLACSKKICSLFGVNVSSEVSATETLEKIDVKSQVTEKCLDVRIMGRVQKRKAVDCSDETKCVSWVQQFYPKSEYRKELERLNRPKVEADSRHAFGDPKECRSNLGSLAGVEGATNEAHAKRVRLLEDAETKCTNIDPNDLSLQREFGAQLTRTLERLSPQGASVLARSYSQAPDLLSQIRVFQRYFKRQVELESRIPELEKLVLGYMDALFPVTEFDPIRAQFVLSNGKASKTNPYLEELNTCKAISEIASVWPGDLGKTITVCKSKDSKDPNSCFQSDTSLVRARFASCVCQSPRSSQPQECMRVVLQLFNESCPEETTPACYGKTAKTIAEKMKIEIRKPAALPDAGKD